MKRIIVTLAMVAASVFNWKKIGAGLLPIALMSALVVFGSTPAQAVEGNDLPCVAAAAYTETVTEAYDETVVDHAAYDEKVIDIPGQDAVPGTDAVYGPTEYQFEHAPHGVYMIRWETDPNWNADSNPNSTGWRSTGVIRTELITPATEGTPAVDEVSHLVHHEAVTHVVRHEAVTVDHPAVVCGGVIEVPAALPIEDECGIRNASWIYSGDTSNDFSWDLTIAGALSAHAHNGFVFANHETVIEFGLAPESNTEACPPGVTQDTDTRQVVGEPDCAAGYSIVSYQERTRAVTDGVPGEWTEWVQVDNGTIPTTVEECPLVVVSPKKVFVCKFVGKPGVAERLKGGRNPILVSVNSLIGRNSERVIKLGDEFSDAQGRSVVVGFQGDNPAPTAADCVSQIRPPAPPDKVKPVSDDTVVPDAGVLADAGGLPNTGGSPLGLLAISGLLIAGGVMVIGRRRTN